MGDSAVVADGGAPHRVDQSMQEICKYCVQNTHACVCFQVTHALWKSASKSWHGSHIRAIFSIMCDLFVASSKSEKPGEVCMAAVAFCTDMLSCPENGKMNQGDFFDVMQVRVWHHQHFHHTLTL